MTQIRSLFGLIFGRKKILAVFGRTDCHLLTRAQNTRGKFKRGLKLNGISGYPGSVLSGNQQHLRTADLQHISTDYLASET